MSRSDPVGGKKEIRRLRDVFPHAEHGGSMGGWFCEAVGACVSPGPIAETMGRNIECHRGS